MNTIPFRRIARNFFGFLGPDSITIRPEYIDPNTEQPLHYGPKQTVIDWDPMTGKAMSITQKWDEIQLSNSGKQLQGQTKTVAFEVNKKDTADFSQNLGGLIVGFLFNGFIRYVLGDNYKPIVGPEGLIPDSAYDTEEPPSGTYHTHDVDGTPFFPELEPEIIEEPPLEEYPDGYEPA